jgi:hypothetical protein
MGRPSLGQRKQVNVRLPVPLVERIDAARGLTSRDHWMELAAENALNPIAIARNPEFSAKPHMHRYDQLVRTEFKPEGKHKIMACHCGKEAPF